MTNPNKPPENLLTTKEVAQRTGKSMATVQKWLRSGKLRGSKIGNRWFIAPSELPAAATSSDAPTPSVASRAATSDAPTADEIAASRAMDFSVEEFCRRTYLTEIGVLRFLQTGRLLGDRSGDGSWRVKAESLDLPHLRHLIRP
ncbi:MAG: helix-turn-helix domain-containing protein [Desulfosarcinaceae bacterium]|nr:helix-turn-helix domain-containing protein [Desulfosarcinaceae bacterium]